MAFNLPTNALFTTEEQRKLMDAMPGCEFRMVQTVALQDFNHHPYHVQEDEEMLQLIKSVKSKGVLVPLIVRDAPNKMFEILAGHRRKYAAEFNSIDTVPALVYHDLSDEDATIIMVDSNLQRENILPSERAYAYRMKAEALRKKILDGEANEEEITGRITEKVDEEQSRKTVEAYIRLTNLIEELLDLVDKKDIPVYAGVDLSYLTEVNQLAVFSWISDDSNMKKAKVSMRQASNLRRLQSNGEMTDEGSDIKILGENDIRDAMASKRAGKLSIPLMDLEKILPGISTRERSRKNDMMVRDYILKAIEFYRENHMDQLASEMKERSFFDEE